MRKFGCIFLLVTSSFLLPAFSQVTQSTFIDVGHNSVSEGTFARLSSVSGYRMSNYEARLGLQTTFARADRSVFSGLYVEITGYYAIREFPVNATLFYRYNPYTSLISETNFGILATHSRNHLEIHLGYNSRIYSMQESATDISDLTDPDMHIFEWRNFMYRGILWLKPKEHIWNVGGSLTNFDYFLIQQETNPMLTALIQYDLNSNWRLYSELWYQGAGMLNLASNYYGFYLRAGFTWQLN